jgi:hypothetical protein
MSEWRIIDETTPEIDLKLPVWFSLHDEMPYVSPEVRAAAADMLLNHRMGNHRLPPTFPNPVTTPGKGKSKLMRKLAKRIGWRIVDLKLSKR